MSCVFVLGLLPFPALAAPGSAVSSKSIPNIVGSSTVQNVIGGDRIYAVADERDTNYFGAVIGNRKLTLLGVDFRGRPLPALSPKPNGSNASRM